MAAKCTHEKDHVKNVKPSSKGVRTHRRAATRGCIADVPGVRTRGKGDSSNNRHDRAHFLATLHAIIRSSERRGLALKEYRRGAFRDEWLSLNLQRRRGQ